MPGDRYDIPREPVERLYQAGLSVAAIGRRFGVSPFVIHNRIDRWNLQRTPAPDGGASRTPAPDGGASRPAEATGAAVPPLEAPFWTPERDAKVIATGGAYAGIAALAARWGVSSARVVGRWHQLRVAA